MNPSDEVKKPRVCARKECGKRATHLAGLLLSAGYGGKCQTMLDLALCPDHAKELKVEDCLTYEGFAQISRSLQSMGKAAPKRKLTEVYTCPIDEAPEVFRERYLK